MSHITSERIQQHIYRYNDVKIKNAITKYFYTNMSLPKTKTTYQIYFKRLKLLGRNYYY